ncbi:hypothetical protein [Cellulomonas sp. ICMP 17802]|uniref:hypothetical protein n=1 Tax=Cellulomonas sp. ICMP 17802 TaxID=3239199 RepID=UPI00351BBA27
MHPELFAVLHQQRERELEAELRRRLAVADRSAAPARAPRRPRPGLVARLLAARPTLAVAPPSACCAPA